MEMCLPLDLNHGSTHANQGVYLHQRTQEHGRNGSLMGLNEYSPPPFKPSSALIRLAGM